MRPWFGLHLPSYTFPDTPPDRIFDRPYLDAGFTGFTFNNSIYRTREAMGRVGELLRLVDGVTTAVA